jgi:predicted transcriptional regulator
MPEFTVHLDDFAAEMIRRRAGVLGVSPEWIIEQAAAAVAKQQAADISAGEPSDQTPSKS